jgi:hypothetical protein
MIAQEAEKSVYIEKATNRLHPSDKTTVEAA